MESQFQFKTTLVGNINAGNKIWVYFVFNEILLAIMHTFLITSMFMH